VRFGKAKILFHECFQEFDLCVCVCVCLYIEDKMSSKIVARLVFLNFSCTASIIRYQRQY
jgi:hypothetical protein